MSSLFGSGDRSLWLKLVVACVAIAGGVDYFLLVASPRQATQPSAPLRPAATAPGEPTGSIVAQNPVQGRTNQVIPPDPKRAKRTDGAAFSGVTFVPHSASSVLTVHIVANASSDTANEAVITVFRRGEERPVFLTTKKVPAGGFVTIDSTFKMPAETAAPLHLLFRIGPAKEGWIFANGRPDHPLPKSVPTFRITVTDSQK